MTLTHAEEIEYQKLHRDCGLTLLYPETYSYNTKDDTFSAEDDKHECHKGSDVRRLRELAELR